MMLLGWVIVLGIIFLVVRAVVGQRAQLPPQDSALEILKRRYARGEVSKEEFEAKKRDLV